MSIVSHVLATLLLSTPALPAAEDPKLPADFKLVAQYYAGYNDWKSWRHTITADGKVSKDVSGQTTEATIPEADVRALVAKVREAEFTTLKRHYEYRITDASTLILTVTMDGKTKSVDVYAHDRLKDDDGVKRFLVVWREALEKVPSPNAGQKPGMYKP